MKRIVLNSFLGGCLILVILLGIWLLPQAGFQLGYYAYGMFSRADGPSQQANATNVVEAPTPTRDVSKLSGNYDGDLVSLSSDRLTLMTFKSLSSAGTSFHGFGRLGDCEDEVSGTITKSGHMVFTFATCTQYLFYGDLQKNGDLVGSLLDPTMHQQVVATWTLSPVST